MNQIRKLHHLLFFMALSLAAALPALADETFPAKLSLNERLLLEQAVCGQKYGVAVAEIDARAFEEHADYANYADVKCRPHARLKDKPIYYVAQCARHDKQWSCGHAELEISVTLRERELIMRPGTVEPKLAYESLQKISTYGYFQAKSLDAALQSTCNMGMGNKPDLIEISCNKWSITVSFWCPKTPENVPCPRVIFMTARP
ncbi:MAG: hypothetical protein V4447_12155 [Pseudomonadota bacterium]